MDFDQTLAGAKTCPNCGTLPATPGFCAKCGQDNRRDRLKLNDLARDALAAVTDLDGRWLVTLRALFPHSGDLASDYVAGRRARFVSPVRLFLVALVLLLVAQEVLRPTLAADGRWLLLALTLYALPAALLLRISFLRTRRTVAEIAVLVLYSISALVLLRVVQLMLAVVIIAVVDRPDDILTLLTRASLAVVVLYASASTWRFFHTNLAYALIVASVLSILAMLAWGGVLYSVHIGAT
jgi:Protein of unknown function (DUF3667)